MYEELSLSQSYSTLSIEVGTFKDITELAARSSMALCSLSALPVPSQFPVFFFFLGVVNRFLAQTYPNTHQQISHTQKLFLALSLSWQWQ